MFERFTEHARQVVVLAQEEARTLQHGCIGTEHILLAVVREDEAVATRILLGFDTDADEIQGTVIGILSGPDGSDQRAGQADTGARLTETPVGAEACARGTSTVGARLPDVRSLSGAELDDLIDELSAEALRISQTRRMLHDKIGILRSERQIRRKPPAQI